jgi:hypothetical protein
MSNALHNMLYNTTDALRNQAKTHQNYRMNLADQYSVNLDELDAIISDVEGNLEASSLKTRSQFNKRQRLAKPEPRKPQEIS